MYKLFSNIFLTLFLLNPTSQSSAQSNNLQLNTTEREFCGIKFPNENNLKVNAIKISEKSLKNRVDNERYAACPYRIAVKFGKAELKLDFQSNPTLLDVKAEPGNSDTLYFGAMQYEDHNWKMIDIEGGDAPRVSRIKVDEIAGGLTITSDFERKVVTRNVNIQAWEKCMLVTLVGKSRWAGGLACGITEKDAQGLRDIFLHVILH